MAFDFSPAIAACDKVFGESVRYTPPVGSAVEFAAVMRSPDEISDIGGRGGFKARAWVAEVAASALAAPQRNAVLLRLEPKAGEPDRFVLRDFKASDSGGVWILDLKEEPAP